MNIKLVALKLIRILHLERITGQMTHWIRQYTILKMAKPRIQIETMVILCRLILSSSGRGIRVRKIQTREEVKVMEIRAKKTNRPMKMMLATYL